MKRHLAGWFAALSALALCAWIARPLPSSHFLRTAHVVTVLDRSGRALGTVSTSDRERGTDIPLDRVAPAFLAAILAAEDARFFEHGAVDPLVLYRAWRGGASTVTMQLARLRDPVAPGWRGKVVETLRALRIARGMRKDEILAAYVNRLPFGADLVGIEAASRAYFGVAAADLTLAQAATLAAIPNAPARLDPLAHPARVRARRAYVLARMVACGWLSRDRAAAVDREPIALVAPQRGLLAAPHEVFRLAAAAPPGVSVVRSTIDGDLQRFTEAQARDVLASLASRNAHDAAVLILDTRTGEVLTALGSPDYFGALGKNDGVRALRQPGSALKPFAYALALQRRAIRPATILADAPVAYALPGLRLFAPLDYSTHFAGPVPVREALASSLNVPAVRVLERLGVPAFLDDLHAFGFTHLRRPAADYGLGLVLGSGEVSLWELTHAYRRAALLAQRDPAWAIVTEMLADPHARARAFGVDSLLALPFPAAVKTGTSSDFRDVWTVGFTTHYTVGVWVGNFDGTPMHGISGISGAAPLWNRLMLHLHERDEPAAFAAPRGYVKRTICATTGERPDATCASTLREWFDRDDLRAYGRAHRRDADRLRIVAPLDGDRFAYAPSATIGLHAAPASPDARWSVDGRALALPRLRLAPGAHTIRVREGGRSAQVRIVVEPPRAPRTLPRGFSLVKT